MGEVYKAKDTRIDRTVAIKVLPSGLADDAGLKQRFEREAKSISSLNHPHICTLYEFDSHDGPDFLVMEHLEGESLAERIVRKGAIPFDTALRYATQIADALEGAHRHGVVHRDLKPGNIFLTDTGAKLLDFGLAKLADPQGGGAAEALSAIPTQAQALTEQGAILGTFQYMAPEQLEGTSPRGTSSLPCPLISSRCPSMPSGFRSWAPRFPSFKGVVGRLTEWDPPLSPKRRRRRQARLGRSERRRLTCHRRETTLSTPPPLRRWSSCVSRSREHRNTRHLGLRPRAQYENEAHDGRWGGSRLGAEWRNDRVQKERWGG